MSSDAAPAEEINEVCPGDDESNNESSGDVKVSGMMHLLLVSGDFESKHHLFKTLEHVYHNFTSIHDILKSMSKYTRLVWSQEIGQLIGFCKCLLLMRILKEDGITINLTLARLLSDIEIYLLQIISGSANRFIDQALSKRICKAYCEALPIYSCDQMIIRPHLMIDFLHHCLHLLDYYETLKKYFIFLKNYLELSTNYHSHCQDQNMLIAVENVAHQMIRYICITESEAIEFGYDMDKDHISEFHIGVLKVLVLQPAPIMSDELVVEYAKHVQKSLLDLLQNKTFILKAAFRSQLWILNEGISFLVHSLISYPPKHISDMKILSNIRLDFQDLVRNVGSVICSCLEREMTLELFDLIDKADVIKGEIIKTICCMVLRETDKEHPKKDHLGSLIILLKNLKEFMDSKPSSIITWKDHHSLVLFIYYLFQNNIRGDNCTGDDEFFQYRIQLDVAMINQEELKEVLISAQFDAFNMACSLLRRYGKLRWWELYSVIKDRVDMHMRVGILEAFVFSNTSTLPDELLIVYGECVQDSLIELLRYDAFYPLNDQLDVLHKGVSFLVRLLSYMGEQEKLSHIKADFQELVRSVGSFIRSSFNNSVNGDTEMQESNRELSTLIENINLVIGGTEKLLHFIHLNKLGLESPKTNQLGVFNSILENWKESMECESDLTWKEKFRMIYEYLVSFKSFLASNSSSDDDKSQNLCSSTVDAGYVAEYLLNTCYVGTCHELWISEFTKNVEQLTTTVMEVNMKKLNINEINTARKERNQVPAQGLMVPTSADVMVGFEQEMELIKNQLFTNLEKLDVISIVGMPGLGKTTLARKVYEDCSTIEHFDVCAWCAVSQEYNKNDLFLAILGHIIALTDEIRELSEEDLSVRVHQQLTGRRYFIVLDDIWDINAFFDLICYFPDNNNGSRIMLTSRSEKIGSKAKMRSDSDLIKPALLSNEQCWDLLKRKIYHEGICPPELCEIGKEIAKNCKGLPLGIVVVSGVLANETQNPDFWEQVARNLGSYIAHDPAMQFVAALELSYTYLPDCLKPMFLYFGAFPEDVEIPAKTLMQLWIAEGFVSKMESSSLESQAEKDLMDLIDRSLVMVAKRKWDGRVKACRVHDLLRDMCLAKAKKEKFMQQVNVHSEVPDVVMYQRRLSLLLKRNDETTSRYLNAYTVLPKFSITPPIYSLLFFNVGSDYDVWEGIKPVISSLKLLKVLDAQMFKITQDALDEDLTMLVHLRYVSITITAMSIPSEISRLHRLETLIIHNRRHNCINVPETIWKMAKLRHVHINGGYGYGKFSAASENSYILENLQTLSGFCTDDNGEEEKIFTKLPALKRLRCQYRYTQQFQFPDFESLGKLESLTFSLRGAPQKLRSQLKFPLTLKKLSIKGLNLEWSQISMLKTLPNLEVLKLDYYYDSVADVDEVWEMGEDDVFNNLKILMLRSMGIKEWSFSSVNFPRLEKLVLNYCKQLVETSYELGEINTLQKIEVIRCSRSLEKQVKEIQKEQEELGNHSLQFYYKKD